MLGATINCLLEKYLPEFPNTVEKLKKSFYVDNCVTSVDNEKDLQKFKEDSIELMSKGKFNLRDWVSSGSNSEPVSVLGLLWDPKEDNLFCHTPKIDIQEPVTRRIILSTVHKLFDPIGFTCPITLFPKLLLQKSWKSKLSWDEEVPEEIKKKFVEWANEVPKLSEIKVPRCMIISSNEQPRNVSLHTFCDASKNAFSAVVFIRSECYGKVQTQMVMAKSRVAPLKEMTIPRLELMACCIGARLAHTVSENLDTKVNKQYFWTDSTTALWWIKNEENWGIFVQNRVVEIRKITNGRWFHVAGIHNPADLPSRGCSIQNFIHSKWWEGPPWLKLPEEKWPMSSTPTYDKSAVNIERKKKEETILTTSCKEEEIWYLKYFSKYSKIVRMVAWVKRFVNNARKLPKERNNGELKVFEIESAEKVLIIQTQKDMLNEKKSLSHICTFKDSDGILRVKTKISSRREEEESFRYPIVLPNNDKLVDALIVHNHEKLCHAGVNILMSVLREQFWILKSRRTITGVIKKCVKCRRHSSKPLQSSPVALPEDRVREGKVYEVTGVDLAGPLILKDNKKAWIVIFTCAIYRAIHLELITSLSTNGFMLCFRRFVARRGRPKIVYSDNGRNFVGMENLFRSIDWEYIERESSISKIQWRFIPPTAAWWGGWWERMIQMLKNLLKRVLGRASLNYEELSSILCDCECVINSRPLTYISNEIEDFIALTPAMFLQDLSEAGVPDLDMIDRSLLSKRFNYQQRLREELRKRFRSEYLSQLVLKQNKKNEEYEFEEGDVVLIGSDGKKRLDWPLARIIQKYPGKDGKTRVVKLKTASGESTRPIQRIYPLEIKSSNPYRNMESTSDQNLKKTSTENKKKDIIIKTARGRLVKLPSKLLDFDI